MKIKSTLLTAISFTLLVNCYSQKTIELPLTQQSGYGYFNQGMSAISTYDEDDADFWKKLYLTATGASKSWSEIKYGHIETNLRQSVYQNYVLGNFTKETYEEFQKSWDWKPDPQQLSKEPLKTKIAFAYGKDSAGVVNAIVDANNNLDFSDDKSFKPFNFSLGEKINRDSVAFINLINVSYERFFENKKQFVTVPVFIAYVEMANTFMCNFSRYSTADFNEEKIAVCSGDFTDLSYKDPGIFLMNDSLREGDKISRDRLTAKNEYIEIKGEVYKNKGVKINSNKLVLEKMRLPKSKLPSTQIGYQSFSFKGNDFVKETPVSSQQLKGKYVLLDFWAVWCNPCRAEIPNLKALYEKTDRKKFEIIGIVGESPAETLKKLIEKDGITWPQILSNDVNKIIETFGIHGYPVTFLINPEGVIVAKNLRGKELEDKVLELTGK